MDRRTAAYQPSSSAESEDSTSGQNISACRRLTSNRTHKQWYDAATASAFAQLRPRRLGTCINPSNLSTHSGASFERNSEPTTSRFTAIESFPSTEELRAGNDGADYSVQQLRDQGDSRFSFASPQITTAHSFQKDPSSDLPNSRHQEISSLPAVLPKKRPLPLSAYNEAFAVHSKHPRNNWNEGIVSYEEVGDPPPPSYLSYSSENVRYVREVPRDPTNSNSHLACESMSLGRCNKKRRGDFTESDYGRFHDAISTSERRNIPGADNFYTVGHLQSYDYNTKGSEIAKERFPQSVYHLPISNLNKAVLSPPYLNISSSSQDLLSKSSPMSLQSEGVNSHYGYPHPFSEPAFNLSSSRSALHPDNTSGNTVNLPQKEVQVSLSQESELCKRGSIETKSANFLNPTDNAGNSRNPTLVHGSAHLTNTKLNCDSFHVSKFSIPSNLNNISHSTNVSSSDVPIMYQNSLGRSSPLNFSSHNVSRTNLETGKLFCSATFENNDFSENSGSSQSFSRSPASQTLPTSESSMTFENHKKNIHSIQGLSNHSIHNVECKSSEIGEIISPEKNSVNSVSGVNLNDRIFHRILHKHPLSKNTLKVKRSSSDRSKILKSGESSRRRRRRAVGLVCGVCGDSARSLHFGGISCDSCKAFFRRAVIAKAYPSFLCVTTGLAPQIESRMQKRDFGIDGESDSRSQDGFNFKSDHVDSCISSSYGKYKVVAGANTKELLKSFVDSSSGGRLKKCPPITVTTRKYCQSCRFQKCIDIGMEISWVTLEGDVNRRVQEYDNKSNESRDSLLKQGLDNKGSAELEDNEQRRETGDKDPDSYLTKSQQRQIENLVEIYRSVFWGVPEPVCYRPALIDFPPAFTVEDVSADRDESQKKESESSIEGNDSSSSNEITISGKNVETKNISSSSPVNNQSTRFVNPQTTEASGKSKFLTVDAWNIDKLNDIFHLCFGSKKTTNPLEAESGITSETSKTFDSEVDSHSNPQIPSYIIEGSQLSSAEIEHIRNLPQEPLGVNMYRKALRRRPRPWLIRQLMGYTLRFMHVVAKILHGVGRSLSVSDRTILLRQGMTRLTFLNSVIMYDTSIEAWPERIFPPLPLVLQDGKSGFISEQQEYLHGVAMHTDEVATVVAPEVLEHQLLFIRGIKTLVGSDFPSMFLLMAIMLFDSTEAGLEQPKIVEQIQSNYCYLLQQYIKWKFHDGPPPNPGDERPDNFSHSPTSIGSKKGSLDPPSTDSNDPKNDHSNIRSTSFTFEKQEGYYFSPPYPPSPSSSKAIYPLLLTKLADLQQTAHNYSSTPFTLKGAEVSEIDKLVAMIQVFMCDILTSGPSSIDDDEGGSGDSGGMSGNMSFQENSGEREEIPRNRNDDFVGGNDGGKPNNLGKGLQNKLSEHDELAWIAASEQDLSWDSCSSKDDDTYSGSSLSVMSMGESIDEIVGAFISSDEGKTEMQYENDENLVRSLEFWDEKEFMDLSAEAGGESLIPGDMGFFSERESLQQKEHVHKYKTEDISLEDVRESNSECMERDSHPEKMTSMNSQFLMSNSSSSTSEELIEDSFNQHVESSGQIGQMMHVKNYGTELKALENDSLISCQRMETSGWQGITNEKASFSSHKATSEETRRYSYGPEGMLPGSNTDAKDKYKTNRSFWDCLKATGRALLGFGSSHSDSKSENDMLQPMTSLQDEKYLDNLVEHVERPESNSSGYVSSPSPLSMMRNLDPLHSGADWEDLFQRL